MLMLNERSCNLRDSQEDLHNSEEYDDSSKSGVRQL